MTDKKKSAHRKITVPEAKRIVEELTLFNNELMSKVFDKNPEATELLLRIILEREDIKVLSVIGQDELKNPYPKGRSIWLDIHAIDSNGEEFDVEIQQDESGSHVRRARFYGSMMDTRMLKERQKFQSLKDAYVIFICKHDKFKQGKPIYHVDKTVRETGEIINDGAHTIFVNGLYEGDDPIGMLMHDFNCKDAKDMYYKPLADGVKHFKEKKGGNAMSDIVEAYAEKKAKEAAEKATRKASTDTLTNNIRSMMKNMHCSVEEAFDALEVSKRDRTIILRRLQKQ